MINHSVKHLLIQTLVFCFILLEMTGTEALFASGRTKPNIILILVDDLAESDLAESDLGSFGNRYHSTPNIDRLFSEGLHFRNGYASAPICSASRAALMTGKTTARLQFEFVTKAEENPRYQRLKTAFQPPSYPTNLSLDEKTIPEYLSKAGYRAAFYGKWHLNQHYKRYLGWSPIYGPSQQGFQEAIEDFGAHPYSYWKQKNRNRFKPIMDGEIPEDGVTNHAVDFLHQHGNSEKPFFLMVSHFFVHTPVHTQSRWLYEKYDKLLPQGLANRTKRVQYAAFVETMDHYIGQLLKEVNELKLQDETLIVFTSDNGGHPDYANNKPYRGSKWNLYEGGIRVPFVMKWPGHLANGKTSDIPVVGYDLLPTFCGLADLLPEGVDIDGKDIFKLLSNKRHQERELVWHFPFYHPEKKFEKAKSVIGHADFKISQTRPHSAIRVGNHKLLYFYESGECETYSLLSDSKETIDISNTQPELKARLLGRLEKYLDSVQARIPVQKSK